MSSVCLSICLSICLCICMSIPILDQALLDKYMFRRPTGGMLAYLHHFLDVRLRGRATRYVVHVRARTCWCVFHLALRALCLYLCGLVDMFVRSVSVFVLISLSSYV